MNDLTFLRRDILTKLQPPKRFNICRNDEETLRRKLSTQTKRFFAMKHVTSRQPRRLLRVRKHHAGTADVMASLEYTRA